MRTTGFSDGHRDGQPDGQRDGPKAEHTVVLEATTGEATAGESTAGAREVEVPLGGFLPAADFSRIGDDLSLTGEGGQAVLIRDYFGLSEPPDLTAAEGVRVDGELAVKLAGPLAPAQYAQAGPAAGAEAIGTVTELTGSAQATRTDGSQVTLAAGDPVFQGDVLQTGGGSSIGIRFLDDTLFSLGGNARLAIDQLVYNPGGGGNALSLSLLQGAFAFVSGQIAPADGPGMSITTPVANIGVRGTTGAGQFLPGLPQLIVTLLEGLDGELGVIDVFNDVSLQTLANVLDTIAVSGIDQQIPPPAEATEAQLAIYALALASLGRAYIDLIQDITPEAGPEQDGGSGSSGGGLLEGIGDDTIIFGEFFGVSDSGEIEPFFVELSIVDLFDLIEENPDVISLLPALGALSAAVDPDPDNSSGGPLGFEAAFVEATAGDGGSGPVPVVDSDVAVTSVGGTVQTATVTLTNPLDGDAEGLDVDPGSLPAGIAVDPASTATTLILTGPASDVAFETALTLVTYANEAANPDETPRVVTIAIDDGTGDSDLATTTISVEAANDAAAQDVGLVVSQNSGGPVAAAFAPLASLSSVANAAPFFGFAAASGVPDGASAVFAQLTGADAGTVTGFDPATGTFFYTPPDPGSGQGDGQGDAEAIETSFEISASDGGGTPSEATVAITARAPDDFSNLVGSDGIDILYANPNGAFFTGDGDGGPTQTLDGGGGDDFLVGVSAGASTGGEDGVPDSGFGNELLIGGAGNDNLFGLGGDDELQGSSGDDLLVGDGDVLSRLSSIDVFLLEDLSGSFFDDLPNVQAQFAGLFGSLVDAGGANRDVAFGVGSFIDKPISPFGQPPGSDFLPDGDFVYATNRAITTDQAAVQAALDALTLGDGGDFPEAQLEALLQVAVRADTAEIGFRDGAARFVVLSTDAPFHVAGDVEGAETPNNGDGVTDLTEDYPSIAQVAAALADAGIVPIFAVTGDVLETYRALADQLGSGVVVELTPDSDNIAQAVLSGIEAAVGGADSLDGGSGNDTLVGGPGDDTLTGGADADLFLFRLSETSGNDRITDFETVLDSLGLTDVFDYDGNGTVELADLDTALAAADGWFVTDDGEDVTLGLGSSAARDQNGGRVVVEGIGDETIGSFADLGAAISLQVGA